MPKNKMLPVVILFVAFVAALADLAALMRAIGSGQLAAIKVCVVVGAVVLVLLVCVAVWLLIVDDERPKRPISRRLVARFEAMPLDEFNRQYWSLCTDAAATTVDDQ